MSRIVFSKICVDTETHSFANTYAIGTFDEVNDHSLPALF